jgi:hypothetical protein
MTLAGAIAAFHLSVAAVAVYRLTGKYLWTSAATSSACSGRYAAAGLSRRTPYHAGGIWH